jgi:hypothetical protein
MATSSGEQDHILHLSQKFQKISGKVSVKGKEAPIAGARLEGDRLSFILRDHSKEEKSIMRFDGRITGDTIQGLVEVQDRLTSQIYNWIARRHP